MNSLFLLAQIVSFVVVVKMTSFCLNPNLILTLRADVVLQSIITLIHKLMRKMHKLKLS